MMNYFKDEAELSALVRAFETFTIHPAEFKHYQHLAVALWYVTHFPYHEASDKMRNGIQKLAAAYGKMGYHETITMFWLEMVRRFVAEAARSESMSSLANRLATKFVDKYVINEYYSAELLSSAKAKAEWVEPDVQPFEVTPEEFKSITRRQASQPACVE
jgi:hypothetical protein